MKTQANVQHALMCLEALAGSDVPLSPEIISRERGLLLDECRDLLERLASARLLERDHESYAFTQELSAITAYDVLQALWYPPEKKPAFRMWVGPDRGLAAHMTLQAIRVLPSSVSDGGLAA
jgi:hypothetical protein